jgi:hypothetical protein
VIATVVRLRAAFALAFAVASACKDAPRPTRAIAAPTSPNAPKVTDSSTGAIDLRSAPYHEATMSATGSVTGSIRSADTVSSDSAESAEEPAATIADTLTSNPPEAPDCVQKAVAPGAKNRPFAGSIVWIAGVNAGKPLPIEKRADLSSEHCLLDPRVQAVVVGTTMNVINDEKVLHRLVFTKLGTRDTLTVTSFFNTGEMVASERLAKTTGIVEVRCARHPWTRAYIAVFDHPYFAVTERKGNFAIDSVPPGSYTLMVWSPGDAKPVERQIQITAGGATRVDLK